MESGDGQRLRDGQTLRQLFLRQDNYHCRSFRVWTHTHTKITPLSQDLAGVEKEAKMAKADTAGGDSLFPFASAGVCVRGVRGHTVPRHRVKVSGEELWGNYVASRRLLQLN